MPIKSQRNRARFAFLFDPALQAMIRFLAFSAAVLFVFSLFYVGGKPIAVNLFREPYDKLAHLAAFGALTFLLWVAMFRTRPVLLVLLVASVGALDEWHQAHLPGRSAGLEDWSFDVLATVIVVVVLVWLRRRVL